MKSLEISSGDVWVTVSQLASDSRHLLDLAKYMLAVGEPPCDKGCEWKNYCREMETACLSFQEYVRGDLDAMPYDGVAPPPLLIEIDIDA